jgi:hypothetical protein
VLRASCFSARPAPLRVRTLPSCSRAVGNAHRRKRDAALSGGSLLARRARARRAPSAQRRAPRARRVGDSANATMGLDNREIVLSVRTQAARALTALALTALGTTRARLRKAAHSARSTRSASSAHSARSVRTVRSARLSSAPDGVNIIPDSAGFRVCAPRAPGAGGGSSLETLCRERESIRQVTRRPDPPSPYAVSPRWASLALSQGRMVSDSSLAAQKPPRQRRPRCPLLQCLQRPYNAAAHSSLTGCSYLRLELLDVGGGGGCRRPAANFAAGSEEPASPRSL